MIGFESKQPSSTIANVCSHTAHKERQDNQRVSAWRLRPQRRRRVHRDAEGIGAGGGRLKQFEQQVLLQKVI